MPSMLFLNLLYLDLPSSLCCVPSVCLEQSLPWTWDGDSWAATEKQLLGVLHTFPEDDSLVYFLLTLRTQI